MRQCIRRAAIGALTAAALLVAACGDDDTETSTDTTSADQAAEDGGHSHGRDQGEGHEVGDADPVPTLAVTAEPDAKSGINVRLETSGFEFSPQNASTEHVAGEGHAHVYLDGEKVGRIYTDWYHLAASPGEHEVRAELNGNDHAPLLVDGEPISQTITVDVPDPGDGMGHTHGDDGFEAADPIPTVTVEAIRDAKSGWNIHVVTTDFTFTPEKVNETETVPGEGHGHLYVDGQKISRLYGDWYHFDGDLGGGDHEVRVELNANDHRPYVSGGEPIDATTTISVDGDPSGEEAEADQVIEILVEGGEVTGGGRHEVGLGDTVTLRVTSDVDDHVHLHGYDVFQDVAAGNTVDLTFEATIPGVFEVELEDARLPLVELEIS